MEIEYKINQTISAKQFTDLLKRTTLGARRPVNDTECMQGMLANSNLVITAWSGEHLVGIARSVTDFHYCCYLSDLAVDEGYQKLGIGKQLQIKTQAELGPRCTMLLIAAPAAKLYYEHIGFTHNDRCWILLRDEKINME